MKKTTVGNSDNSDTVSQIDLSDNNPQSEKSMLCNHYSHGGNFITRVQGQVMRKVTFSLARSTAPATIRCTQASTRPAAISPASVRPILQMAWTGGYRSERAHDQQRRCGRQRGSPEPGGSVGDDVCIGGGTLIMILIWRIRIRPRISLLPSPTGIQIYNPAQSIPLSRVIIDPATGHDGETGNRGKCDNGWLDASMVYGSDQATAHNLRSRSPDI